MKAEFITLANFALCAGVAWATFCRLNAVSRDVQWYERAKLALLFTAAIGSALQGPLFGERPGVADVLEAAAMFVYLAVSARRWRNGPPPDYFNANCQR